MDAATRQHLIQIVLSDESIDQAEFKVDMAQRAYELLLADPMPEATVAEAIGCAGEAIGEGIKYGAYALALAAVVVAAITRGLFA